MEKKRGFKFFGIFLLLLAITFSLYSVSAILDAPTGLIFSQNVTPTLDSGTFNLNWTALGANVSSYTIYIWADNVLYTTSTNDSATGLEFTNTTDANYTFHVAGVNGSEAGLNSTNISITVDATAPTVTITKLSSTKTSLRLTLSGTEGTCVVDRSGAAIEGDNLLTESSLTCGTSYAYVVTCTDSATNAGASASTSFSTDKCSSGGSAAVVPSKPKKTSHSFLRVTPKAPAVIGSFDSGVGLKEIKIDVNDEAKNVKVAVTKYDGKPTAVSVAKSGKVNQYIEIDVSNVGDKLDKANIQFKVMKSWISSNGLEKEDVGVFKFNEVSSQWQEQLTTYSSEDDTYYYYDVEVDSFSFFAISEASGQLPRDTGEDTGTETTTETETGSDRESEGGGISAVVWIILIIIVLIALNWGMKARKKKK